MKSLLSLLKELRFVWDHKCYKHLAPIGAKHAMRIFHTSHGRPLDVIAPQRASHSPGHFSRACPCLPEYPAAEQILQTSISVDS